MYRASRVPARIAAVAAAGAAAITVGKGLPTHFSFVAPSRIMSTGPASGRFLRSQTTMAAAAGMGSLAAATTLQKAGLEVELVSCLDDNYCPIIHHAASGATLVVDTPDGDAIAKALKQRGWVPTHILNTHHHDDHVQGNLKLKEEFPSVQIVGPKEQVVDYPGPYPPAGQYREFIPGQDVVACEGDEVLCGGLKANVLEVGGHTSSHIAYFFPEVPMALTGDALFTLGCGRVFTGDFTRMQASLGKLRNLPDETVVYCAHEYTNSNLQFALKVEPENEALRAREREIKQLRASGEPTVPTILGYEKATNPFLRWDVKEVQKAAGDLQDPAAVFTAIRKWKDTGKAPRVESRL
eukprot:TRINITY_DN23969_c0_g6_i1.p1 TRINITY_DN23969_c0_g6~~TRINITY_DN23969_c0_g6_i1.p1  ORF type:complete len:353 (-),score=71.80 TRINITY_DN23969_c0_g6_i1:176-1234(-)